MFLQKLGGSDKTLKHGVPNTITKDEEEVAEALFALASTVDEPDKDKVDRITEEAEVPSPLPKNNASSLPPLEGICVLIESTSLRFVAHSRLVY